MAVHIMDEASRCLQCKKPRCREGCPINTNIPEMIRLFREDQMMAAAQMLFANNPLSVVCSLVCDHEKQCEGHCVRGIKESPVHISAIENYISDSCFERLKHDQQPKNGMKVAVIGSGPAGITIALVLALRGYSITVFETRDKIGGILRYGIPDFRLPHSVIDRYYEKMKSLGILFRPNFAVGGSVSIQDLLKDGYKSVFIGTGAWRPRRLNIPGETFGNVQYAINYLNNPEVYDLGEKVAIIGSGNAAMDVARTAIRQGAKEVTVYVRGDVVSASPDEYEYAKLDGVQFELNQTAIEIKDEGPVICDTRKNEEGKTELLRDTARLVEANSVIIAVSQVPQDKLVNRDKELHLNEKGNLETNDRGETTMEGVFASGDVVTGARTVVSAVRYSKEIANDMEDYMRAKAGLPPIDRSAEASSDKA
ncbi:MAG: NAD(P)-dependent oxidoreductase [Lachnospiraceae bacterium]|nr:NAD(P)-dependent oxidoreductase [Lachnospiraceae bacterium]